MSDADTPPEQSGAPAPAAGAELSIPKYRLDEVSNELRRVREELAMKDRLYLEERQRALQQQQTQNRAPELTPEETGLDPQTHQAVSKMVSVLADRKIAQERALFEQQIGMLASRTEKAELLASKGADKGKYLPEIQSRQQEHYRATGTFLPAEIALELIQAKEKDDRIKILEAKLAGQTAQAQAPSAAQVTPPAQSGGVPNAAMTRQIPGGGAASPAPSQSQKSLEDQVLEMEARLQEQFGNGAVL